MSGVAERALALSARAMAALPDGAARLLAGKPVRIDGQQLDPKLQLGLRLEGLAGGSDILPLAEARERRRHGARVFSGPRIELPSVTELELPGPAGPLGARRYAPSAASHSALIVYFHGGGFVVGDLDTHDQVCRFLAREVPAVVLSVDYRLAPEHPFPAAVDDALASFRWAHSNATELGADPARVAVAGDSAGGNLAAVVANLSAADGPAPSFQGLIYPVTDLSSKHRSYELFAEGFFLTEEEMDWYRGHYLPEEADRLDPRASPILAEDLTGVAPAYLLTCGFDPLRDEGEAYAQRLREAGVAVELRREPDLVHGIANTVALGGRAREAATGVADAIRAGLAAT